MEPEQGTESDKVGQALLADRVFDGTTWHSFSAVLIRNGRIFGVRPTAEIPTGWLRTRLPAGVFLAPGFIDLQVNGGGGLLLNDAANAKTMSAIARVYRRFGTTACLPTLISDTREQMRRAIEAATTVSGRDGIIGLHLEGPFISPLRPGVHSPERITRLEDGDLEDLCELGKVGRSLITLAPECVSPGYIRKLVSAGVRVSIGHSEASSEVVTRAVEEGATGVTHLFNAMPPMSGRSPGVVGAALSSIQLIAGLIVDGIHVDPVSVRAAFAAKGADGIALVTDGMPTVGSSIEGFELLGRKVRLIAGRLVTQDGALAGAHLDMSAAVRNVVQLAHLPLEDALRAASVTPARFLGLEHERGALIPGARADLVALTECDLGVVSTWVNGVADRELT